MGRRSWDSVCRGGGRVGIQGEKGKGGRKTEEASWNRRCTVKDGDRKARGTSASEGESEGKWGGGCTEGESPPQKPTGSCN